MLHKSITFSTCEHNGVQNGLECWILATMREDTPLNLEECWKLATFMDSTIHISAIRRLRDERYARQRLAVSAAKTL